jgi:hypothetical protein
MCHEQTSGLETMIGPRSQSLNDPYLLAIEADAKVIVSNVRSEESAPYTCRRASLNVD